MTFGAAYIRVSTDHQDEYSPDAQRRCILDYAKKNDIVINKEHIFADIGISGTKADKREAYQKMIALAKSKEHPIDTILVWKFSRFARNQEESILYKSLLSRSNVSVISVSEPINEGPFGKLIERILEWMDEYYSIRLSGEVKRGMMQKALSGGYNSKIPYGYKMDENKIPVIVPEQAKVVQMIFDQYVNQHESISNITLMLNETGYRTARGNKFERRVIHYILQNPFYIGQIRWNYAPRARGKKKDGDIIIRDGKHKPLISVEMFEQAQELIKTAYETYHGTVRRVPSAAAKHWLSGVLKCSTCGSSLSFCKGQIPHFKCWKYNKGTCSTSNYLNAKKAEQYVLEGLKNLLLADKIDYEKIPANTLETNTKLLQDELRDLDKKMERIKMAYIDGIDSLDEYKSNKKIIDRKRREIEKQLVPKKAMKDKQQLKHTILDSIKIVIDTLESDCEPAKKSEAIRSICHKIEYNKENDTLYFDLYMVE